MTPRTHNSRTLILSAMFLALAALFVFTILKAHTLVHSIYAMEKQLNALEIEARLLQQTHISLKADFDRNIRSARINRLQKQNLPDYQRPKQLLQLDQLPYLQTNNHVDLSTQNVQ